MKKLFTKLAAVGLTLAACSPAFAGKPNLNDFHLGWLDGIVETPYKKDEDLLGRTYMIVMDASGSMNWDGRAQCPQIKDKRINVAKRAASKFAETINPNDKLGMVIFKNGTPKYTLPFAYNNGPQFASQVNRISPDGGTPLRSSVLMAFNELRKEGARKKGHGEYHLVVISDGDPSSNAENPASLVKAISKDSPIQIHSIGFCLKPGHPLNQPFLNYYQADNEASLTQSLQSVLAESKSFSNTDFQ
ncbi:MAG: VWA domain-containing protein [Neptunomonas phycophila]|uniref:vWA domain-containing protein n=1 Tax=Neptunomonas phycophila TaxID=1572645 RepID=UPI003B8E8EF5